MVPLKTIKELFDMYANGELKLPKEVQWHLSSRIFAIELILEEHVSPVGELYIENGVVTKGGETLRVIFDFIEDKFKYHGKVFSGLTEPEQKQILNLEVITHIK